MAKVATAASSPSSTPIPSLIPFRVLTATAPSSSARCSLLCQPDAAGKCQACKQSHTSDASMPLLLTALNQTKAADMNDYTRRIRDVLTTVRHNIVVKTPAAQRPRAMYTLSNMMRATMMTYPTIPAVFLPLVLRGVADLTDAIDTTHQLLATSASSAVGNDDYPSLWHLLLSRIILAHQRSATALAHAGRILAPADSGRWATHLSLTHPCSLITSLTSGDNHLPFDAIIQNVHPSSISAATGPTAVAAVNTSKAASKWQPKINVNDSILQMVLTHQDIPDHVANTLCQLGANPYQVDQPDNSLATLTDDEVKWRSSLAVGSGVWLRTDASGWQQASVTSRRVIQVPPQVPVAAVVDVTSSSGDDEIPAAPAMDVTAWPLIPGSFEMASASFRAMNPSYAADGTITQIACDTGYMLYMDVMSPRLRRDGGRSDAAVTAAHMDNTPVLHLYGRTPLERAFNATESISGVPFSARRRGLPQAMIDGHNIWKQRQQQWLAIVMNASNMVSPVALITFGYCGTLIPF